MKRINAVICFAVILCTVFALCTFGVSAGSSSPIKLTVRLSDNEVLTRGIIHVDITLENITDSDLYNVLVTSGDSKGLVYSKPNVKNVIVTHPLTEIPCYDCVVLKNSAKVKCLKAKGKVHYSYDVLVSYQGCKKYLCENDAKLMCTQHKLVKTKAFTKVNVPKKARYEHFKDNLYFGDFKTVLDVKAYYGLSDTVYDLEYDASEESSSNRNTVTLSPVSY